MWRPLSIIGAFESTYQPRHDVDVAESTGHVDHRAEDLMLLRGCGVRRVRYPIRWHRLEPSPGRYDWSETDEVLGSLRDAGWSPIVDLVHHTSYPQWLEGGFADARFADSYLRYVRAVATRYPWIREYTLFNEPFATLLLCGHEGIWPPYQRGMQSFIAMLSNVLPAISAAAHIARELWPEASHLWCDSCERHSGEGRHGSRYARYANDRRFFVLDALLGTVDVVDRTKRPFVADVLAHGGRELLDIAPMPVDEIGLDYYAHCQWHFEETAGTTPTPIPPPFSDLIVEYASRYARPVWIGETNLRGFPSDRATWLKYTLEQCEAARDRGVDIRGYCWFPFIDSCDWSSLLYRSDRDIDPVGVYSIDEDGARRSSVMSMSYVMAAQGARSAELPAYRFAEPVASWLRGWMPQMAHWQWLEPPGPEHDGELHGRAPGDPVYAPLSIRSG